MGRLHQGMDRPGVRQVPEGSGEQGKMEKTSCKIICGAQTTLAVKGLMMMMMMSQCICDTRNTEWRKCDVGHEPSRCLFDIGKERNTMAALLPEEPRVQATTKKKKKYFFCINIGRTTERSLKMEIFARVFTPSCFFASRPFIFYS